MARPNVLVIMSDQMKATASHLWGSTFCETPSLGRMADEGVLFSNAVTPHPLCVPARCALWTSQYPHANGCRRNETLMPASANHAFKLWKNLGFRCGLIGKNHCFQEQSDFDLFDVWCPVGHGGLGGHWSTRGMEWFRSREDIERGHSVRRNMPVISPSFTYAASDFPIEDYSTGLIAGQTVRFLEQFGQDPFALWVSFPDPHTPYEAPRRYFDMLHDAIEVPPNRENEFADAPERNQIIYRILGLEDESDEDIRGVLAAYYGMVRFVDDGVGQILDALDRLKLRENTIVVFCADHGDFSGEHNMTSKGGVFYDCLTHVPMIVSAPSMVQQGIIDDSLVSLVDIVPSLFQLQGIEGPRSMQGEPLPGVTDAAPRDAAFSEYGCGGPQFTLADLAKLATPYGRRALMTSLQWREAEGRRKMVRTREWKYVHDPMGDKDELYDLVNDPWELANVVDDLANSAIIADLQRRLADWSIMTEDSPPVPLPDADRYQPWE